MHRLERLTSHVRLFCDFGKIKQTVKKVAVAQTAAPPKETSQSLMKMTPPRIRPSISFHSLSFVCFRMCDVDRDVSVAHSAPQPRGLYKAEVGRIWLKDIKFCSYFIWMKVETGRVREELSLPATYVCTIGHKWQAVTQVVFAHFFKLS